MRQYLSIFGTQTPWFGICAGTGLLAIGMWMRAEFARLGVDGRRQDAMLSGFPFMVCCGVLCAFLLDVLFTGSWTTWGSSSRREFGFTYVGWMLGCITFLWVYGKYSMLGSRFLLNFYSPAFALAQAIGRVGCFLGGCCYGVPWEHGFCYPCGSLPFEKMGNQALFPVQPMEAALLALLFAACLRTRFTDRCSAYLIGVSAVRFACDFFRADVRGGIQEAVGLSPQQMFSVLFFTVGLLLAVQRRRHAFVAKSRHEEANTSLAIHKQGTGVRQ